MASSRHTSTRMRGKQDYSQFVQPRIQRKHPLPQKVWILFGAKSFPQTMQPEDETGLCKLYNARKQILPIMVKQGECEGGAYY